MQESGQMDRLVNDLRIGKRTFLVLSPALVGMLPVPGGALLSSPLVERVGEGMEEKTKAALNVWFRHVLLIVYPFSPALIASAKIAGLGFEGIDIIVGKAVAREIVIHDIRGSDPQVLRGWSGKVFGDMGGLDGPVGDRGEYPVRPWIPVRK